MRITVPDDYQDVAPTSADRPAVTADCDLDVVTTHIDDVDELVARLQDSKIAVAMPTSRA